MENLELLGVSFLTGVKHEDDPVGVSGHGRPAALESVAAGSVPQLDVGFGEAVGQVQVGGLELEDADSVGRSVRGIQGVVGGVGQEV